MTMPRELRLADRDYTASALRIKTPCAGGPPDQPLGQGPRLTSSGRDRHLFSTLRRAASSAAITFAARCHLGQFRLLLSGRARADGCSPSRLAPFLWGWSRTCGAWAINARRPF